MLDAVLGSTGSPWIPEHHPGGFQQRPQCVPVGGQGDGGTGSDIPAVPCLPELPCTSAPCQAAAPRSFSSISFTSNCLLQPSPNSSQNEEGAPWGSGIHTLGRALPQRSCELRTSRASAPVLDWELSLICLGHSGGLGTSFSRNAALTGHNSCCAASLPGMGFLGHTLGSHRALPPLPSLGLPLRALQLHFPSQKCIKKLNFPPDPSQPSFILLPEVSGLGESKAEPGGSRGSTYLCLCSLCSSQPPPTLFCIQTGLCSTSGNLFGE